jgi:formamidopyrimidine-DNA glycosylase
MKILLTVLVRRDFDRGRRFPSATNSPLKEFYCQGRYVFKTSLAIYEEETAMIEIPEATVLARQIDETLKGKRIADAEANHTPHGFAWYSGDPKTYGGRLKGRTVTGAHVFSGNVRIETDGMTLLISTPIRYHEKGAMLPEKHQLLIAFEDGSALTCTVQMWGCMFCYSTGDESHGVPVQHFLNPSPTPLDDGFDRAYFDSLLASIDRDKVSAKAFLATEQRIPGFGNGVLQDVLWTARIHPKRKMTTLTEADLAAMFDAVKSVTADMAARGGRDTERDLFGRWGGYKTVLSKNTAGQPCPACGTDIRKEAYLGGAIYYCENCQK